MDFCIFLKISERYIFASRGLNIRLNPITPYIRWKVYVQTFQKFKIFWSWATSRAWGLLDWKEPRKRKIYDTNKWSKTSSERCHEEKFFYFFFYPYKHPKTWRPLFFDILFWWRENWSFFLKIWSFCLFLPQIPFLAIKMVKNNIFR